MRLLGLRPRTLIATLAVAAGIAAMGQLHPHDAGALERAKAPAFRIKDLDGKTVELAKLLARGPVLIDFWATWCKPCHAAIPELNAWHEKYGDRLTVLGVSVDGPRNHGKVRPFVARMGIDYPVAIDQDGRVQKLFQVVALPTAVLIDRDGNVVTSRVGFRPGEGASLEHEIEALLAPKTVTIPVQPETLWVPAPRDTE